MAVGKNSEDDQNPANIHSRVILGEKKATEGFGGLRLLGLEEVVHGLYTTWDENCKMMLTP